MGRDYRLGYSLGLLGGADPAFELGVEAERRERPQVSGGDAAGADQRVLGRGTVRW